MLLIAPCCDPKLSGLETDVGSERPEVLGDGGGGEGRRPGKELPLLLDFRQEWKSV